MQTHFSYTPVNQLESKCAPRTRPVYLTTLSQLCRLIAQNETITVNDVQVNGRDLFSDNLQASAWRNWGKYK